MNTQPIKPVVLCVLDGWGIAPPSIGNAIALAKTENYDSMINNYPSFSLQASGESVGLPWGEMGNSEVGHLSLGSGRILYQNLPRITKAISDGSFEKNQAFAAAFEQVKKNNSTLHIMGLVSDGGVHSYNEHMYALLEVAKMNKIQNIQLHAFLDGRDTSKNSGLGFVVNLEKIISQVGAGRIASLSGRFYAMDRDNHWERIAKAYQAIALGQSDKTYSQAVQAVEESYKEGIFDEEFYPTVILDNNKKPSTVKNGDAIIYFNFRSDRARQLTKAFILPDFSGFDRQSYIEDLLFVTMTEYEKGLPVQVAFPPEIISQPLARIISENGGRQVHIAETEKYAHVTFFFNGGKEKPWPGEEHIMVPSPRLASYAKKPAMSSYEITDKVLSAVESGNYDFILLNFAAPDMVAHTGNLKATISAVEAVDDCLGNIMQSVIQKSGALLITADHGNAEEVVKLKSGEVDKEHSSSPVPLLLIGKDWQGQGRAGSGSDLSSLTPVGVLADVAPTILQLMGLPSHSEMTGKSLL